MSNSDQLYRIRPLVFTQVQPGIFCAETAIGTISMYSPYHMQEPFWGVSADGGLWSRMFKCDGYEAAVEAAEQWHRERLAADLLEVTTD
jgi:hypothetical protein